MKRTTWLMAWILGLSAAAGLAADPAATPLLDRAAVLQSAAAVTRAAYPNADDVLVDDWIRVRYEKDGTSLTTDETWLKVLTEEGKRDNQSLSFYFTLPYGDVTLDILEIVKPDGAAVPVDVAKQSRVMVDRSQMASNIFNPNSKILKVGLPGLEAGDLVHYRSVRRVVKPRVPDTWSDYTVLEYTSPIKRFVYEVDGPTALPLRSIALKSEIQGTVKRATETRGDRIHYRWEASQVPRMYEEPNMPPLHTVVQRLLVSTIGDWREISQWYWSISEPHFQTTPEMAAKVAELTQGLSDRREKMEAIFRFVSQKIRYMGITTETEAPGYEPHDVKTTFEEKYGVCRDKAALLAALLRLAKIDAFPVLIHNGPKKDADVPQPYFNHAIVAAQEADGSYTLMDATDENTREMFPSYLCDQSYLVAKPTGETLLTSPIVPASENMMSIATRGKLSADGDLTLESVLEFEGINDNVYRGYFSRIRPEQRRQLFEAVARRVVAGARLVDMEMTPADLMDTSEPLTAKLKIEASDVPLRQDGAIMLPLPRIGAKVGMVNFLLGRTGLDKRKYPLVTKIACGLRETFTLDTSALTGAPLAMPEFDAVDDKAVTLRESLKQANGALTGETEFLMKVVEFSPEQYLNLKDTLRIMEFNGRKQPLFAAQPAERDVEILRDLVEYDVEDGHTWTVAHSVRKRILTYAGKKEHSELKLSYNPVWETVTLESATVTTAQGEVKTVRAEERNVMDAEWVGSAPRYPAAKTLVVSLPGVDVGSVIETRVVRRMTNRPFFALRETFRGLDPIQWRRVILDAPADLPMSVMSPPASQVAHARAMLHVPRLHHRWTVESQPGVERERNLPPWWSFNPTLCLSSGQWPAYADQVHDALTAAAADQKQARAKGQALCKDVASRTDRIRAIRDFVARNVRSVGPGLSALPLSALTPADRTLADGYGNSADRAALLYALLRAAGLKPQFVLASRTPRVTGLAETPLEACPDTSDFDSVLVRVVGDVEAVYLNDTDQYAPLGATHFDGYVGLELPSGALIDIAATDDGADRDESEYRVVMQPDGTAHITRTLRHYGLEFAGFKRKFSEIAPEERRRYHQEVVAGVAKSAKPAGPLVTDFESYPGVESFSVIVPNYAVRDGKYFYFTLPDDFSGLMRLYSQSRKNPFYWSQRTRQTLHTIVALPQGFQAVMMSPADFAWECTNLGGLVVTQRRDVIATGPHSEAPALVIEHKVDFMPAWLPASDYDKLLKLDRTLRHPESRTILLQGR